MAGENLAALKRMYDAWAVGDWTDASILDPHVVGVMPDPSPRVVYGAEALAEYTRGFLETWKEVRVEANEFREHENSYVVRVQIRGTGTASGLELAHEAFHVWTFRGRRAIRFDIFSEEAEALAAAGLDEGRTTT